MPTTNKEALTQRVTRLMEHIQPVNLIVAHTANSEHTFRISIEEVEEDRIKLVRAALNNGGLKVSCYTVYCDGYEFADKVTQPLAPHTLFYVTPE